MAAKKQDQLSVVGVTSAVAKNLAQQRSLAKARERKNTPKKPKIKAPKAPKDTRTAAELEATVELTRATLVSTVAQIRYDLDLPARARDLRSRIAVRFPRDWHGETPARVAASAVVVVGLSTIVAITKAALRARRVS
ncbi:MAG: hypothetical protein H7248_07640 [Microbacteriaceae bacterium]|nr:hypothetical protein [Microbacteriaceae bacterium]